MQFNHILIVQNIIAFDRCAVMNLAAPDAGELEVLGHFFVNQLGNVSQCAAATDRVGLVIVGFFLVGQLGIDADDFRRVKDRAAQLVQARADGCRD